MFTLAYDEALRKITFIHKFISYDEGVKGETEVMIKDNDDYFFMPLGGNCTKRRGGESVSRTTTSTMCSSSYLG